MTQDNDNCTKAKLFFDRAAQVAVSDNFDYAIDMYIEGLRCSPDALQEGHLRLRELGNGENLYTAVYEAIWEQTHFSDPNDPANAYRLKGQGFMEDIRLRNW